MSRLTTLSPEALKMMFSVETNDTLVILLTFSGANIAEPQRICDNYTQRISETAEDVLYGVVSRSNNFIFLPFELSLPSENDSIPKCNLTIHDVTKRLLPIVRQLDGPPTVKIELVLKSSPDVVEIDFGSFILNNISYNSATITGELLIESLVIEPIPAHTFTPTYFQGLF